MGIKVPSGPLMRLDVDRMLQLGLLPDACQCIDVFIRFLDEEPLALIGLTCPCASPP